MAADNKGFRLSSGSQSSTNSYGMGYSAPPPMTGYGYPPPAVTQQPGIINNTTTVVVQQAAQPQGPVIKSWDTDLLGCCEDVGVCMLTMCCYTCAMGKLANELGEVPCLTCWVPNALTAMRTRVRTLLNIHGSIFNDCLITEFCTPCAICQMLRQIKIAQQAGRM